MNNRSNLSVIPDTPGKRTRFGKVYIEITNVCNLHCTFCHGTGRVPRFMTPGEFSTCLDRLQGYTRLICLHVMGEPLLHPDLEQLLSLAFEKGFSVNITTNGSLIGEHMPFLLNAQALNRINISLHSYEANAGTDSLDAYLRDCVSFALQSRRVITCYRLWNTDGQNTLNDPILSYLHRAFPQEWKQTRKGCQLSPLVYMEFAKRFDWPDIHNPLYSGDCFCYGLRDQAAILCDGTVTPCCLDSEGSIPLGNLFTQTMETILNGERARNLYEGFSRREAREELCRHCDYEQRYR